MVRRRAGEDNDDGAGEDNDDGAGEDNDDGAGEDNDDGGQFLEAILWLGSAEGISVARRYCQGKYSTIEPEDLCQRLVEKFLVYRKRNSGFLGRDHRIERLVGYLAKSLVNELRSIYRGDSDSKILEAHQRELIRVDDDGDSRHFDGIQGLLQEYRDWAQCKGISDDDAMVRLIALIRSELELAVDDIRVLATALVYFLVIAHPEVETGDCRDSHGVHNADERAMWIAMWFGNREYCFEAAGVTPAALRKRRQKFAGKVRRASLRAEVRIRKFLQENDDE